MIIDSDGREIKLLIGYLKGTVWIAQRSYYKGGIFVGFESNKSKSDSSIIIAYPWPMKIKLG